MIYKNIGDAEISDLIRSALSQPNAIKKAIIYQNILKGTLFIVDRLIKKYRRFANYEDLRQVGLDTLYRAILSFKPDKCPKFYGWAVRWIKKNIAVEAYRYKKHNKINDLTNDAKELASEIPSDSTPEDILLEREKDAFIWDAVRGTGSLGAKVLMAIYEDGIDNLEEISRMLGISRRRVENTRDLAILTLRNNQGLVRIIS